MNLRTVGSQLTLGSVFKLFVIGWICSWSVLTGSVLLMLILVTLVTGQMMINGQMVDASQALVQMAPLIVLLPLIVVIQGFMFSGFLTFGVWLYRLRRPLTVSSES